MQYYLEKMRDTGNSGRHIKMNTRYDSSELAKIAGKTLSINLPSNEWIELYGVNEIYYGYFKDGEFIQGHYGSTRVPNCI